MPPESPEMTAAAAPAARRVAGPLDAAASDYTLPIELHASPLEVRARNTLLCGSFAILGAIAWAALTPIQETAGAPGELVPAGQVRTIQHLEGGVVSEILARDGSLLDAGQPILLLSPSAAAADLGALRARRDALRQQQTQVHALLRGDVTTSAEGANRNVFEARMQSRDLERRAQAAKAEQRRAELQLLEAEALHLQRLVTIQVEQLDMRRRLAASGYTSRRQLLETEAQLEQARQALSANAGRQAAARQALTEAEQHLSSGDADARRQWSEEAAKIAAELGEVEETVQKLEDRFERLVVRAPVRGTLLQIVPRSPGEVVKPGDPIARFVPSTEPLLAEVRIRPNDIAHIREGDAVKLTLAGTDPRVHGTLTGKVHNLSATSFKTERGDPYFRGQVAIDPPKADDRMPALVPGMIVRAEIVTGAKTMLRYLLRPVFDTLDLAFRER